MLRKLKATTSRSKKPFTKGARTQAIVVVAEVVVVIIVVVVVVVVVVIVVVVVVVVVVAIVVVVVEIVVRHGQNQNPGSIKQVPSFPGMKVSIWK